MSKWVRTIDDPNRFVDVMNEVWQAAEKGLKAGAVLVTLGRPTRSIEQNAKFHAIISDIHRQCFRGHSIEGLKAVLVAQFAREVEQQGTPLSHPGEQAWDWKNECPVYVRPSTTKFTRAEAAQFIEFLYATGSEYGVIWSPIVTRIYDEMRQAA